MDLETAIAMLPLATDPEGDPLIVRLTGATNGTARLSGDGRTVLFAPETGFSGTATFSFVADDGFTMSAPNTVTITVSNAPLISIDFIARQPRIGVGGGTQLQFIGDFADQTGVLLPGTYLTLSSTNDVAGQVRQDGRFLGIGQGYGAIVAARGDIQAATAFMVGAPADIADAALATLGLTSYPGAVTLVSNGGSRQILLSDPLDRDVAGGTSGTRYFSSDPSIIEITADGRILGKAPGEAIVTAIHKMAESRIAVKVAAPQTGPATVGADGGVVQGDNGMIVAVAPGALGSDTTVSLQTADPASFGVLVPPTALGWQFGAAFHLDVGSGPMKTAAQLAIPTALAAGTSVSFYRLLDVPAPDGSITRGWLEVETGVVDANGIARTSSPPYPGITGSGDFVVLGITPGQLVRANITLEDIAEVSFGLFQAAQTLRPLIAVSPMLGLTVWAAASAAATYVLTVPPGPRNITVRALGPDSNVYDSTPRRVEIQQGANLQVRSDIVANFDPNATRPQIGGLFGLSPALVQLEDVGSGLEPILTIRGQKLLWAPPGAPAVNGSQLGTQDNDVRVIFRADGREAASAPVIQHTDLAGGLQEIKVRVPQSVAIGTVTFEVKRTGYTLISLPDGSPYWLPFTAESSDAVRVNPEARYVFAAGGGADNVLAISMTAGTNYDANEIVARIPVGDQQTDVPYIDANGNPAVRTDVGVPNVPRAVAVTGDNTRAYVTFRGIRPNGEGTGIGVIDAITLQQIDAVPDVPTDALTQGVQYIKLNVPDARPFWIVVDDAQRLAFVGDEGYSPSLSGDIPTGGRIYVIDIDPSSATYHQHIGTLTIRSASGADLAPLGLRGMVMSGDGQLLLAAPDKWAPGQLATGTTIKPGFLIVGDVRNMRAQLAVSSNLKVEQVINVGPDPYGLSTTSDANRIIFTNKGFDGDAHPSTAQAPRAGGVGLLTRAAGSRTWNTPTYLDMTLGSAVDALDLNNAQGVIVTSDLKYAFVTGFNTFKQGVPSADPDVSRRDPAGGNVGVIRDPFNLFPSMTGKKGLVAVTRQLPWSNPDNLALSSDGKVLWAAYSGIGQVAGYSVDALINAVETMLATTPPSWPVNHPNFGLTLNFYNAINNFIFDASGPVYVSTNPGAGPPLIDPATGAQLVNGFGAPLYRATGGELLFAPNTLIDLKADFRMPIGAATTVFSNFDPARAPLNGGILVRGLAAQSQVLTLVGPDANAQEPDSTPKFQWKVNSNAVETTLYVTASRGGEGLFPKLLPDGTDAYAHRILTKTFAPGAAGATQSFELPPELQLTRGQTYYWGIEARAADGRVYRDWRSFKVETPTLPGVPPAGYDGVVVLIDGFELPYTSLDLETREKVTNNRMRDFADRIAGAYGGVILEQSDSGWVVRGGPASASADPYQAALGGAVVLMPSWAKEVVMNDSGFAEAAADQIFASIAKLLQDPVHGAQLRNTAWNFVGFSRGASVASEVIQRLATYFPASSPNGLGNVRLTTLDAVDPPRVDIPATLTQLSGPAADAGRLFDRYVKAITSYSVITGETSIDYSRLFDPNVRTWSNIYFHDNYYGGRPGDGSIPSSDLELDLTGRAGFTGGEIFPGMPLANARTLSWYVGTAALSARQAPFVDKAVPTADRIWRSVVDAGYQPKTSWLADTSPDGLAFNSRFAPYSNVPWYRARDMEATGGALGLNFSGTVPAWDITDLIGNGTFDPLTDNAPWEGIGQGWFYSYLGGATLIPFRQSASFEREQPSRDNTEFGRGDGAVPSIYNGNFQASARPVVGRFVPTGSLSIIEPWLEVPGWSLRGSDGGRLQGLQLTPTFTTALAGGLRGQLLNAATASGFSVDPGRDAGLAYDAIRRFAQFYLTQYDSILQSANLTSGAFGLKDMVTAMMPAFNQYLASLTSQGARLAVLDALKVYEPDLTGVASGGDVATRAAMKLAQEYFADWAFRLDNGAGAGAAKLQHNWMYVSPSASYLTFALDPENVATGSLNVSMELASGSVVSLGTIDLDALPGGFTTQRIALPGSVKGEVVKLTFELTASGSSSVLIDDIQFDGLLVSDTSGATGDEKVLFLDDTDPVGNPTFQKVFAQGKNIHEITITNPGTTSLAVRTTLGENYFLVGYDGSGAEVRYDDGASHLLGDQIISAGGSITLKFKADLDFKRLVADGKIDVTEFPYDQWLMRGVLRLSTLTAVGGTELTSHDIDLFYLADLGDRDADDGILTFAQTREGASRSIRILNDTPLEFETGGAYANRFEVVTAGGPVSEVRFDGVGVDGAPLQDALKLKSDGTVLGEVRMQAQSVAKARFSIDAANIANAVGDFLLAYESYKQSGNAADIAAFDLAPTTLMDGTTNARKEFYEIFAQVMRQGTLTDNIAAFTRGVFASIELIYGGFIGTSLELETDLTQPGTGPSSLVFKPAEPGLNILGAGRLDLDARNMFGPPGVLDAQSYANPINPLSLPWDADLDIAPAGVAHRTEAVMNVNPLNQMDIYLATNIADFTRIAVSRLSEFSMPLPQSKVQENYGRWFGITIAHELAHTLGFLDEYYIMPPLGSNPGLPAGYSSNSFMSTQGPRINSTGAIEVGVENTLTVSPPYFHRALMAAAFKDPAAIDRYWGFDNGEANRAYYYADDLGTLLELNMRNNSSAFPTKLPGEDGFAEDTSAIGSGGWDAVSTAAQFQVTGTVAVDDAWTARGSASMASNGVATIAEDAVLQSRLVRGFQVPVGAHALSFRVVDADFDVPGNGPNDAFEVALLDPTTGKSLLGGIGLTRTDALLNIQADGTMYRAAGVTLSGLSGSVFPRDVTNPIVVTIDLTGIDVADGISLYFDLLGFGDLGSRIVIDDVHFVTSGAENPPPVAANDVVTTDEDVPILIDVLANDTGASRNTLSITAVGAATHGSVAIESGKVRYTPNANFFGTDSFNYDISDGFGGVSSAQVNITVASVNDDPVAHDDTAVTFRNTPVTIDVLANDTDVDGGSLAVTAANGAAHGTLAIVENKVVYTPNADFAGEDAFVYSIVDGQGGGAAANVTVTIRVSNRVPVITPVGDRTVEEGQTVDLVVAATDPDGDALTFSLVGGPAGATIDPTTGAFTWTPADDTPAPVGFTVRATDVLGDFSETSFAIGVVNAPPAILAIGAANVVGGTPYSLELLSADPGDDTVVRWEVDWGDGTIELLPVATGTPSSVYGHTYTRAGGNFDIKVAAIDEDGTFDAPDALSVTVLPDFLSVESFTATATGFRVRFDHAYDPSRINLAVGPGRSAADTDIKIVGDLVGALSGNVVLDADNRGFSFTRTEGRALQFDRYRLTLGSGDEGFRDQVGALDGNNDGVAGDDFVTEFAVRGTGTGAFNLPDFMRGPGQSVNVPAVAQGLPVRFESDGTVRLLVFSIDYDPRLITLTDAAPATGLPAGATVRFATEVINATQVRATITIITDTPIPAGKVTLVNVMAFVPATAPYASREVLALRVRAINGDDQATASTTGGLHVVGYMGDLDGDAKLTSTDSARFGRMVTGLATTASMISGWTDINPLLVADFNADGRINALDNNALTNEVRGRDQAVVPDVPPDVAPIMGAAFVSNPSPDLAAPSSMRSAADGTAVVDWSGRYSGFTVKPSLLTASQITTQGAKWFDAPWVRDLAARLAEVDTVGTERTLGAMLARLTRGVARSGR